MPPYDKHTTSGPPTRPFVPTLASNRTAKSPLTPRLAASTTPTTPAPSTPVSRRPGQCDVTVTPRQTLSREDQVTPVKAFINGNVTPRSSSRKSRADGTYSTPKGTPISTPTHTRPGSLIDGASDVQPCGSAGSEVVNTGPLVGSKIPRSRASSTASSHIQSSAAPSGLAISSPDSDARNMSPMFFHASEAKPSEPNLALRKAPTFAHASRKPESSVSRSSATPSPSLSNSEKPKSACQFFHADGSLDTSSTPLRASPSPTAPTSLPYANSPLNPSAHAPDWRPPSPGKEHIHLSYRKGASQVARGNFQKPSSALGISMQTRLDSDPGARRRSSVGSATSRIFHNKSTSLSSIDSIATPPKAPARTAEPAGMTESPRVDTSSSVLENDSAANNPPTSPAVLSMPQSPVKSPASQTAFQQMSELAANARRERKVMDLEISNSSLMAINRQLEREVRKQRLELRRFRRLSRAGRFSLSSSRSASGAYSALDSGLSDMAEEADDRAHGSDSDSDPYESSHSSFDDDDELDDDALSDTARADRDATHRARDERRLRLDLSKHRELLVDSQRINQSLRRCMGLSEELIRDGQRALSYQVRVGDVKLGGKVLTPDAEEEDGPDGGGSYLGPPEAEDDGGDGSSGNRSSLLSAWRFSDVKVRLSAESERTDLDSGVDFEGDGDSATLTDQPLPTAKELSHSWLPNGPER